MSIVGRFDRFLSCYVPICVVLVACVLLPPQSGQSEESASNEPALAKPALRLDAKNPTIDEMRAHATTIAGILELASERVERLAEEETGATALIDAIRHELTLSRQWNRHLGTILLDVAEARRALGKREREAAQEIARMTAIAEEARLELLALRNVLQGSRGEAQRSQKSWSEGRLDGEAPFGTGKQVASSKPIADAVIEAIAGPKSDLADARATLKSVQKAQQSAISDVDAVRAKIIGALETLARARGGDLALGKRGDDADLSSEDITSWAASTATRLSRSPKGEAD